MPVSCGALRRSRTPRDTYRVEGADPLASSFSNLACASVRQHREGEAGSMAYARAGTRRQRHEHMGTLITLNPREHPVMLGLGPYE